ncbi:MAG: hypothetical protein H0U74_00260 [Bradymonadaceae bacterium]|nr:hypothetical protein [Lujinxingiaceae bacterium]
MKRSSILAILSLCLLAGCGGQQSTPNSSLTAPAVAKAASPSRAELDEAALSQELDVRRRAYVELFLQGVSVFDPDGERCQIVAASTLCTQTLHGCRNEEQSHGSGGDHSWDFVSFGYDIDELAFEDDGEDWPAASLLLSETDECSQGYCAMQAASQLFEDGCHELKAVRAMAAQCALKQPGCSAAPEQCKGFDTCLATACEDAAENPWSDELEAEVEQLSDAACSNCGTETVMRCTVVHADACAPRAATVCTYLGDAAGLSGYTHVVDGPDGAKLVVFETE